MNGTNECSAKRAPRHVYEVQYLKPQPFVDISYIHTEIVPADYYVIDGGFVQFELEGEDADGCVTATLTLNADAVHLIRRVIYRPGNEGRYVPAFSS